MGTCDDNILDEAFLNCVLQPTEQGQIFKLFYLHYLKWRPHTIFNACRYNIALNL